MRWWCNQRGISSNSDTQGNPFAVCSLLQALGEPAAFCTAVCPCHPRCSHSDPAHRRACPDRSPSPRGQARVVGSTAFSVSAVLDELRLNRV
jgi:hypothetical protein